MRRLASVILALFVTAFLSSAAAPHCVPGSDDHGSRDQLALLAHDDIASPHGATDHPDEQDCVLAGDLTPGNIVAASMVAAPKLKSVAFLGTVTSGLKTSLAADARQKASFRIGPRGSPPPYAVAFARTDRLLI